MVRGFNLSKGVFQTIRQFHSSRSNPLQSNLPEFSNDASMVSIYKVPANMRQVENRAYDPNIVSIGPYHRGLVRLKSMKRVKQVSLRRLVDRNRDYGLTQDTLFDAVKCLENKVRACYSDSILNLSSDEFIKTLVTDGCFILELFRESAKQTSTFDPLFTRQWMLPVLRRDLIMLENQIPFFVLSRLFDLTRSSDEPKITSPLVDLALNFFDPLMPRDEEILNECIAMTKSVPLGSIDHLLALFRSSFLPRSKFIRGKESHVIRSISELRELGVKFKKREACGTLDISFINGALQVPPMFMEDHTGTLFRNVVAFEQCHHACKPDFTSFLFFINGIINTPEDVGRLHYTGIIQHSLGSDEEMADLFNKLCREVARDFNQSYLHLVSRDLGIFCDKRWNKWRAEWHLEYMNSPLAVISLVAAVLLFTFTAAQTYFDYMAYIRAIDQCCVYQLCIPIDQCCVYQL